MAIKLSLKTAQPAKVLPTVSIVDLAAAVEATDVRIITFGETGKQYMHLVRSDDQYQSVGISSKIQFSSTTPEGQMKELITRTDIVVYTGDTDKEGNQLPNQWYAFGPVGNNKTVTVSVASLFGKHKPEGVK